MQDGRYLGTRNPWSKVDRFAFVEAQEPGDETEPYSFPIVAGGRRSISPPFDLAAIETAFCGPLGKVQRLDLAVAAPPQSKGGVDRQTDNSQA
jgi:hypothetical protein